MQQLENLQNTSKTPVKNKGGRPRKAKGSSPDNLSHTEYLRERERLVKEIADQELMIEKYREENRIEFFEPIRPYQYKILEYLHQGKKTITLQGANRIGKTVIGAVIVGTACLGIQPWDGVKLPPPLDKPPVKVRILCSDWDDHAATVIVPELHRWLPRSQYKTSKNNQGVEADFVFANKSTIQLITNKQDTQQHEGWSGQLVWQDEPQDESKYIANARGLVDYDGVYLLTMTAVKEAWILDKIIRNNHPSYASVTEIPIFDNPHLKREAIDSYASKLPENQKIARIQGGWLNLVGLVWKFNAEKHLIDDFRVPTDWPVVAMIDFHPGTEQAISFIAVDKHGFHYVIDEVWAHMKREEVADVIIRKKIGGWRIEDAYIDPLSKGDMQYVKNNHPDEPDSFNVIKDRLSDHGIELHVASKDKDSGLIAIEGMLEGPNGMPTLFFLRSLNRYEKEGHIWEIQRWTYDDKGKPKDEADHFMENLYRYSLVGNKWTPPVYGGAERKSELDFSIFGERRADL